MQGKIEEYTFWKGAPTISKIAVLPKVHTLSTEQMINEFYCWCFRFRSKQRCFDENWGDVHTSVANMISPEIHFQWWLAVGPLRVWWWREEYHIHSSWSSFGNYFGTSNWVINIYCSSTVNALHNFGVIDSLCCWLLQNFSQFVRTTFGDVVVMVACS